MAIKQISVETEIDVRKYTCLSTDELSNYPTDCLAGSQMDIVNPVSGKIIAHALFDGIKWNYVKDHDDVSDMLTYELVDTTGAIIPLQLENKKAKKFLVRINPDIEQSHAMALAGAVTVAGDITITVTSDVLTVPVVLTIPVLDTETLQEIGANIVDAINKNKDVTAFYSAIFETIVDPEEIEPDAYRVVLIRNSVTGTTDATLNIALALVDAEGLTPIVTSTELTSGLTSTAKLFKVFNVMRENETTIYLDLRATIDLTFLTDTFWDADTPEAFLINHVYEIKMVTRDGGTYWLAKVIGDWTISS